MPGLFLTSQQESEGPANIAMTVSTSMLGVSLCISMPFFHVLHLAACAAAYCSIAYLLCTDDRDAEKGAALLSSWAMHELHCISRVRWGSSNPDSPGCLAEMSGCPGTEPSLG